MSRLGVQGLKRAALGLLLLVGGCTTQVALPESSGQPASAPEAAPPTEEALRLSNSPDRSARKALDDALSPSKPDDTAPATAPMTLRPASGGVEPVALSAPSAIAVDAGATANAVAARPAGAELAFLVIDLESGRPLAELNPDLPLIPASTVKLATAIVALDVLGPGHRYRTELLADGPVRDGVLAGDLILKGNGDPALDVADLLKLAVQLRMSGIRAVDGRFLIDDTALPRLSEIEPTQPPEAAYNPGLGPLSLAYNRVRVAWRGSGRVDVTTLPPLNEARFETASPSRLPPGGVEFERDGDDAVVWRVAHRGGRRQEIALPVKDPGLHAGHVFRWLAEAQGIALATPRRAAAPEDARRLAVHESAPLRRLLRDMLVYSNNMMAEIIGLSAAARLGDASAGLDATGGLILDHLRRLMPEVDWRGAEIANHSGLDGTARMTPRQIAAIARYGWREATLPALLAGGGWSGTLTHRFDDAGAALRVWAKTGTLNYGSALAGYLFPETGRPAVFVTMVSDIGARLAYDVLSRPDRATEAAARAWNARARALQDDLIESWLEPLPAS